MTTIVQVANFVAPHSGGIRTVLGQLADGYAAAGHEVVQIVPGRRRRTKPTAWGRREIVPGRVLPRTGYRLMPAAQVRSVLEQVGPDCVEVHDRTTLRGLGAWAAHAGVGSLVVSHERLDRLVLQWTRSRQFSTRFADRHNATLAGQFDHVVCTTAWAAAEFARLPIDNLHCIPLGVDQQRFHPRFHDRSVRRRFLPDGGVLLVLASRLSPEKRPGVAVDAVAELQRRGVAAKLVIAGDGPLRARIRRAAEGLPVQLVGHIGDVEEMARLLASADVLLAPGPVETFGLAATEALASGTPVVANEQSALPSVLGAAGVAASGTGPAFADAIQQLLSEPEQHRRLVARQRAEQYSWRATVDGFLAVHGLPVRPSAPGPGVLPATGR